MWVKIDDGFADHPKVVGLSDKAFRRHITAMCYAARHLTDGHIPPPIAGSDKATRELVAAGIWDTNGTGYSIHDYLAYQPTRDEVEERRKARAEAGRRGGLAKARNRLANA